MTAALARLDLWRVRLPLREPYRLAFGPLHAFDCVFLRATDAEGCAGWGEAALLPGYTDETGESCWAFLTDLAPTLIGQSSEAVAATLDGLPAARAFSATAVRTAVEQAAGHPALAATGRVRLLAGVNGKPGEPTALEAEIERLLAAGCDTLKVKVGFGPAADREGVDLIRRIVSGRARLRIDANQGFTAAEAVAFLDGLDPAGIELVEQPCAAGDWDAAAAAKRAAAVPLMLDESIYGPDDIRRAADLGCANVIKLKLMKAGGLDRLIDGLALIRACGMGAVLGNGVASGLGCWMEACVAAHVGLGTAGEMNGFRRPAADIAAPPLAMAGPDLSLDGVARAPDPAALDRRAAARAAFG